MVKAETPRLPGSAGKTRWASGSSSLTRRSADATEANLVARRPVSAQNRRRRTGSSRVAPTATAHRAAFRHRLEGGRVPSLGFRNGHLGPCIGPAQPAAGADGPGSRATRGSPARGTPAGVRRRRRLGESVGGAHRAAVQCRCCTRSLMPTLASCFGGERDRQRGGWRREAGYELGAARGAARWAGAFGRGDALSGGVWPPEPIDSRGMSVTPPETGRGEGRDASKARFSGQGARGPALCEPIASTEGEAPAGGAFAAPAGWRQRRRSGAGTGLRGALGVRGFVLARPPWRGGQRRRRRAGSSRDAPSSTAPRAVCRSRLGWRARAIIGVPQWLPEAVLRARRTRRWCRRSGQPRSARQPGPRHTGKTLGGGGVWGRGCDVHTWKGSR